MIALINGIEAIMSYICWLIECDKISLTWNKTVRFLRWSVMILIQPSLWWRIICLVLMVSIYAGFCGSCMNWATNWNQAKLRGTSARSPESMARSLLDYVMYLPGDSFNHCIQLELPTENYRSDCILELISYQFLSIGVNLSSAQNQEQKQSFKNQWDSTFSIS